MKAFQAIKGKVALLLVILIGLTLPNCSKIFTPKAEEDNSIYLSQSAIKSSSDFPKAIAALEKITVGHPDPYIQTKAHLQLAILHSSYKNPKPDYQRALDELKVYMFLDPDGGRKDEIQNLLAVLRELQRLEKENNKMKWIVNRLTIENQNLADENKGLKETIEQLEILSKGMEETIEQLKSLDLQLEEKRKKLND